MIFIRNQKQNSIQVYNLNGKLLKSIIFHKEGPDATETLDWFYVKSLDSIFVCGPNSNKVFLTDLNGKFIRTYEYSQSNSGLSAVGPWINYDRFAYCDNTNLILPGVPIVIYEKNPNQYYKYGKTSLVLNIKSGEANTQISYPNIDLLKDKDYPSRVIEPKCTVNTIDKQLIYSYSVDHFIYVFNFDGQLIKKIDVRSKYAPEIFEEMDHEPATNDPMGDFLYYMNGTFYERVVYDPFRKQYYRIVKRKMKEELTRKVALSGKPINPPNTLIVCDSQFNTIGEFDLPEKSGSGFLFPTKDGLLIQTHKSNNENEIRFEKYQFTKIDEK